MRVLLDPSPEQSGGPAPVPVQATVPPTSAPAPQPAAPAPPQFVQVPYSEFQALASLPAQLAQIQAERQAAVRVEQEKATQALLAKGQAEDAVKKVREDSLAELNVERQARMEADGRARNFARDTALSLALANHNLRPGAAPLLVKLIRDDLEAHPEGSGFAVRTPLFKSAADHVAEILAKPEYAGFIEPTSAGGLPAGGGKAAPTGQPATPPPDRGAQLQASYAASRGGAIGLSAVARN